MADLEALRLDSTGPHPSSRSLGSSAALSGQQLAELLVQHFPKAWRVARRMGLSQSDAEEAAQEAFVVLFRKTDQLEAGKELAFLLATVARIVQNLRRKSSFARELPCDPDLLEAHSLGFTVHDLFEQKQAMQLVDEILARQSEPLRVVFVLYELERLTLQEIAEFLDIPLGTAGSRLRLARQSFEKELSRLRQLNRLPVEEP